VCVARSLKVLKVSRTFAPPCHLKCVWERPTAIPLKRRTLFPFIFTVKKTKLIKTCFANNCFMLCVYICVCVCICNAHSLKVLKNKNFCPTLPFEVCLGEARTNRTKGMWFFLGRVSFKHQPSPTNKAQMKHSYLISPG
jgi:hypothetical protein